jgi:succinate-acetate transporter protein
MSNFNDLEKQTTPDEQVENFSSPPVGIYDDHHSVDSENLISKVTTSSDGNYVYLGKKKFAKEDLAQAFGGTLNPGLAAPSTHKFANPAPLGLSAFALSTFVLSMANAGAMGIKNDAVVVGLAMFYGGLIQLLSGMWEMALENTFGALALSSFGGFWMSFGAIHIPWFHIADSYDDPIELKNALGFYLLGWSMFTWMLCLCTMKSTLAFFALFFFLALTFLLLSIANFTRSSGCEVAGGVVGTITAFISWYNAYAGLANKQNAYVRVQALQLPVWGQK